MPLHHPVWKFFVKLPEKHQTSNGKATNYYLAKCKACIDAAAEDQVEVEREIGRVDKMLSHVKICQNIDQAAKASFLQKMAGVSGTTSSTSSWSTSRSSNPGKEGQISDLCSKYDIDRVAYNAIAELVVKTELDQVQAANKKRKAQSGLNGWVLPKLSSKEIDDLHKRLLVLISDAALPFRFVERESFLDIIKLLRPSAVDNMPTRRQLSGSILNKMADIATIDQFTKLEKLTKRGAFATLIADGWKTVDNTHLLGSSLAVEGHVAVFLAEPEDSHNHGLAQAKALESLILKAKARKEVKLGAVTTDDAPQVARGRRILALRFTDLIFLKCWAHQMVINLDCFDEGANACFLRI